MKSLVYKKEIGISGILSESWRLFNENLLLIFVISFVVYIPVNIILNLIPVDAMLDEGFRGFRAYFRIVQLLEFLIGTIATMAIAFLVKARLDNKKISAWTALKEAMFKWPAAILTSFVAGICLLFLFLLLIVPGVIYSVYWLFVLYAVVLKDEQVFGAMSYSKSVVKGRWWKTVGYAFVFGLLAVVVSFILGLIFGAFSFLLPVGIVSVVFDIVSGTFVDFLIGFFTVVFVVFFLNFDATKKK